MQVGIERILLGLGSVKLRVGSEEHAEHRSVAGVQFLQLLQETGSELGLLCLQLEVSGRLEDVLECRVARLVTECPEVY